MQLRRWLVPSAWLVGIALAACGGAKSTDLFAAPESVPLGTDPSTETDAAGATSSGTASGTSGSSGSSGQSSSGSSSGSTSSSGGSNDAGKDAQTTTDGGATVATVRCGANSECAAETEICCLTAGSGGKTKFQCRPANLISCVGGTTIACDDRTDCPTDQVCCGTLSENSRYTDVGCRTSCDSTPENRVARFCDPKAAVDECAALKKTCATSDSLAGYYVCRD